MRVKVCGNRHRPGQCDRIRDHGFIPNRIGIPERELLDHMDLIAVDCAGGVPPSRHLVCCIDRQDVALKFADGVALVQLDIRVKVLATVKIDDACGAARIPAEDDGVLVLHGLESHLNAEIRRHAGGKAVRVGFVVEVILVLGSSIFLPNPACKESWRLAFPFPD